MITGGEGKEGVRTGFWRERVAWRRERVHGNRRDGYRGSRRARAGRRDETWVAGREKESGEGGEGKGMRGEGDVTEDEKEVASGGQLSGEGVAQRKKWTQAKKTSVGARREGRG